ncbi:hypothetical protein Pfo_000080 [Paulownia fortunei]|nr:hypothetical protein Pfo_000080 [Paulownia fortunei]
MMKSEIEGIRSHHRVSGLAGPPWVEGELFLKYNWTELRFNRELEGLSFKRDGIQLHWRTNDIIIRSFYEQGNPKGIMIENIDSAPEDQNCCNLRHSDFHMLASQLYVNLGQMHAPPWTLRWVEIRPSFI